MKGFVYNKIPQLRQWLIVLITFSFPFALWGQSVDSLISKHTDKGGKVSIKSLLNAVKEFPYNQPLQAFETAQRVVSIAERQKEPLAIAQSLQFLGSCYFQVKADYDSAVHYFARAKTLYDAQHSEDDLEGMATVLHNFGTIKQVEGNYAESIDYYLQALKLFDEIGNNQFYAYTLNNISTLYSLVGDHKKSEKYARECITLSRQEGESFMEATGNLNLSVALMKQGKYEESLPPLETALEYGKKNNEPYKIFLYHLNYSNYLMDYKKDYPLAVQELEKAHRLADSVGDEWEIMRHNSALSEAYLKNKQFGKARAAAQNALQTAEKLQA